MTKTKQADRFDLTDVAEPFDVSDGVPIAIGPDVDRTERMESDATMRAEAGREAGRESGRESDPSTDWSDDVPTRPFARPEFGAGG